MLKAIIIDDEPAARRLLCTLLASFEDQVEIIAEAATAHDAITTINTLQPDVVFLDIQLPDGTGFDVLQQLTCRPDIIFTTAYEQYALKAFESFSVDYLLKPIREERLEQSLQKLKQFGKKPTLPDWSAVQKAVERLEGVKKRSAFPIRQGDKIILIHFERISYFEACDKYVAVFTTDGKKYLTDQTLNALAETLPHAFLRVQKSYIINREKIREIHKHFNGRFIMTMEDQAETRIITGLTFYDVIKESLGLT